MHAHAFDIFNWKIWQRRTFFSPLPLKFHNFFRVFRHLDELSINIHGLRLCHTLVPQTDRDHKSFNRVKNTRAALPKKHEYLHGENFMAILTTLSVVIWFSTGTPGIFATLVYVFTMRVIIYDILSMAIIPKLSTSILFCNLCYILL